MCSEEDAFDYIGIAVGDSWGIYCPQVFCQQHEKNEEVLQDDWDCCLRGPHWEDSEDRLIQNEWYWEAWTAVLDNWYTMNNGRKIIAYQDGDVFYIVEKSQ
jgi:hypothetical protein